MVNGLGSSNTSTFSERRLQRAVEHVDNFWLPVQVENIEYIRAASIAGSLDLVKSALFRDPALYLYVCREQAKDGHLLNNGPDFENVQKYLPLNEKSISPYRFDTAIEIQLIKHQEFSLSLASALELATSYNIEDHVAYSAIALRALGMQLILWNYTSVFLDAQNAVRPTDSLETILTRTLGFSPTMLALRVIGHWGIGVEITDVMTTSKMSAIGELCRIGEALARASAPELYPTASKDWAAAKNEIEIRLGKNGLQQIESRYHAFVRDLPVPMKELKIDHVPFSNRRKAIYTPPTIIASLAPETQILIADFYAALGELSPSVALASLSKAIFPKMSFDGMSIFTIEPSSNRLIRQCQIGEVHYPAKIIDMNELSLTDPFTKSFSSTEKVITSSFTAEGATRSYLLQSLGSDFMFGVLYLEGSFFLHDEGLPDKKIEAQVLKATLLDALAA